MIGLIVVFFPVVIFLLGKLVIKIITLIYRINFSLAAAFSHSKKNKESQSKSGGDNSSHLPNILINNKDFDPNCLINLKLLEMMDNKKNDTSKTDFLEMKQKMMETYFNQKLFELEMKQKMMELEENQKRLHANSPKNFLDEIPQTLRRILEKLTNVEEMQFEILKDDTKKTYYSSDDRILYVNPEDFLYINKALVRQKHQQLNK
ncbi:hypothetical protein CHTY_003030 [Candidatus Phytoplasma meliae]|uniref:Uncharacterized protein n=2 Tax=Candidatus Phytoplasma meliae TaxID=1848402 RepID=A0ABS5CXV5_9MOLU|nr:hypothetical protein [Candidatus Phytoplasma meliae]MBP5836188.1 hypothetical protein [Candidatus Phytoplasma meliae]